MDRKQIFETVLSLGLVDLESRFGGMLENGEDMSDMCVILWCIAFLAIDQRIPSFTLYPLLLAQLEESRKLITKAKQYPELNPEEILKSVEEMFRGRSDN